MLRRRLRRLGGRCRGGGFRGRCALAEPRAQLHRLRVQRGEAFPRLRDFPLQPAKRPADELGGLDEGVRSAPAGSFTSHGRSPCRPERRRHESGVNRTPGRLPWGTSDRDGVAIMSHGFPRDAPGDRRAGASVGRPGGRDRPGYTGGAPHPRRVARLQPRSRGGDRPASSRGGAGPGRSRVAPGARQRPVAQPPVPARRGHRRPLPRVVFARHVDLKKPPPDVDAEFHARGRQGDRAGGAARRRPPERRPGPLRPRGGASGLQASYVATVEGRMLAGFRAARRCLRRARTGARARPVAEGRRTHRRHLSLRRRPRCRSRCG